MEKENNKTDWRNRFFYLIFILLILFSIGFTFKRIFIEKNYQILAEVSCDPQVELCFYYEPEECAVNDNDCLLDPEEAYSYKLISKKASNIYACEQTEDKIDCGEELSCLEGEENCEYIYCDPNEEICAKILDLQIEEKEITKNVNSEIIEDLTEEKIQE